MSEPQANHRQGASCHRGGGKVQPRKKIISDGKINPKAPPVWGKEGKYSTGWKIFQPAPPAQQPQWCWRVAPWDQAPPSPVRPPSLLGGQHRPRALCIARALGVTAPPGQAKAACNQQPRAPACAVALLAAQAAAGRLKSVVSKVGVFTWQAQGTFELAVKDIAEFQFSLCFQV